MNIFRLIVVIVFSTGIYGCSNTPNVSQPEHALPVVIEPAPAPESAPAPRPAPPPVPAAPPGKAKPAIAPVIEAYRGEVHIVTIDAAPARKMKSAPHKVKAAEKATLVADESDSLNKYAVKVSATETIKIDLNKSVKSAGQLKVWIGQPGYEPATQPGMVAASNVLETKTKAESAKVKPEFSDPAAFDVEPKESKCQGLEPAGSEVPFTIMPNKEGKFKVGASVELYKSEDCTGAAITRTAEPITVKVSVSISKLPFYQEIWNAFMDFFKEFLAICFALLLFLFRKKLKQIFSFEQKS